MTKRKVIYRQLNIRMSDQLHKQVVAEAKKNGWSVNRELVRRLEQSFTDQKVEALIRSTAQTVAGEVNKYMSGLTRDLINKFNVNVTAGQNEQPINLKKEENSND
jgi:hypothetical protein